MNTDSCPRCGVKLAAPTATDWTCPCCGFDPTSAHEQASTNSHQGDATATQQVREVKGGAEEERLPSPGRRLRKVSTLAAVLGLGISAPGCLLLFVGSEWMAGFIFTILFVGSLVFLLGLVGIITSGGGVNMARESSQATLEPEGCLARMPRWATASLVIPLLTGLSFAATTALLSLAPGASQCPDSMLLAMSIVCLILGFGLGFPLRRAMMRIRATGRPRAGIWVVLGVGLAWIVAGFVQLLYIVLTDL